jgi:hypothetical protein
VSDFDTLRWGDTQTLSFATVGAAFPTGPQPTKQLVHAHWRRPLTWKLLVNIQPSLPAVEAGTFHLIMRLTVGCGGGMQTIPFDFVSAPVAGVYAPVLQFFDIPAQDIQIVFDVNLAPATDDTLPHSWLFGAFVAPFTEPSGSADTAALLTHAIGQSASRADPDSRDMSRWIPPGFEDGELRYRR